MRKFLSVLLSLAMLMSMLVVPVAAEDEASGTSGAASAECHLLAGISAYEVMEGETVTVTLHSEAMTVKTFSGGLRFDSDALTCIGISTGSGYDRMADGALMTQLSTTWEANANGNVGLSVVRTAEETYDAQELLTVTFTAAAPAESGTYIGVYEDSDGMDGFAGEGAGLTLYIRTGGMPHEHVYDQQVPDDMFCLVSAATCEAPAVYYWSCICGEPGTETFTYGDALGHTLMVTPARQPSTEEPGNSTYWTCGRCGKYFSDAAGTVEIEEGSWVIPPLEVGDAFTAYLEPSAGQVCPGQEFTVTAKVRNAPKFAGFQLLIKYDADRLEPVKNGSRYTDQDGSILSAELTDNVTAAGLSVTYIAEKDVEASEGTLCTFKFKVKDGAPAGKADITVETDAEFDGVWVNTEYTELTDPAYQNTSITIAGVEITGVTLEGEGLTTTEDGKYALTIIEGGEAALTAKVEPAAASQAVTWRAGEGITVTDGKITTTSGTTGTFTVTAAAGDKSAACIVTVTHGNLEPAAATPATCEGNGRKAHWFCSTCNNRYTDSAGTQKATEEELTDPMKGHDYGALIPEAPAKCSHAGMAAHYTCSRCGDFFDAEQNKKAEKDLLLPATGAHGWIVTSYVWADDYTSCTGTAKCRVCSTVKSAAATDIQKVVTTTATCQVEGEETYTAAFADTTFETQVKTVSTGKAAHTLTGTDAVEPTCTTDGNYAYWTCSVCDGVFGDAEGTTETTVAAAKRNALGHSYGQPVWSWADDGKNATVKLTCTREGCGHSEMPTVTVSGDTLTPATCTAKGTTRYTAAATLDGETYNDTKDVQDIPMEAHKLVKTEAKAATCVETGNNAYWICSVCKGVFKDEQGKTKTTVTAETLAVDPANHVGGTVQRDAVAETCSVSGREADTYCKSCGVLLQRGAVIPATGRHTYGSDGRCTVCGNKNPAEGIKTDDIKASDTVSGKPVSEDNQGRIVTDGSGLVARTEGPADESKVEDIKAALNDGSISVLVKDSPETIPAAEDGGLQALEAMASSETDAQRKQALERLVKMFRTMSSSRRNVQAQVVYNTALKLYDDGGTEVADLMQIPSGMRVSMAISEAMYRSLKNKELCILRGSTNAAGETVAEELSAVLGGSEGSRVVTFTTDKAGALMLVAYESTSNGGGHGGGSGTYTAPTTGDAGVTVWCMVLGVSALLGTALLTKKRRQA